MLSGQLAKVRSTDLPLSCFPLLLLLHSALALPYLHTLLHKMRAVKVVGYHKDMQLVHDEPEPKIEGPLDVIVKIGAF